MQWEPKQLHCPARTVKHKELRVFPPGTVHPLTLRNAGRSLHFSCNQNTQWESWFPKGDQTCVTASNGF